ncbi:MAG: polyprenyl synthetase family protein [Candidatus Omnitrophica bacterium]|nr:polyprenyl synthetase family protein [Candidatus Omnitrophota bacterium]
MSPLAEIVAPIEQPLASVGRFLSRQLAEELVTHTASLTRAHLEDRELLSEVAAYVSAGQGKLLRPTLVLLAAQYGPAAEAKREALVQAATAIELVHDATLIHDDIIDEAPLRRRRPSVPSKWGSEVSVIMGDFLYAKAFSLLAALGDLRVIELMAQTTARLCQGEMHEVERRFDVTIRDEEYVRLIDAKTAALMAASCETGAQLAGASPEVVRRLSEFGRAFGLAFQIADDCLDFVGDAELLGKAVGADVGQGNLSLPAIYWLRELPPAQRDEVHQILTETAAGPDELRAIVEQIRRSGAVDAAYAAAAQWAEQAKAALPEGPARAALAALTDYAVSRNI